MSVVINGQSRSTIDVAVTRMESRLTFHVRQLEREMRRLKLDGNPELDLSQIKVRWNQLTDSIFVPMLETEWLRSANATYDQLQVAVQRANGLTADARSILNATSLHAAVYLTSARKALSELGLDIWNRVKDAIHSAQRVVGSDLIDAVTDAVTNFLPSAQEVARTLMRAAIVRGSLQQMMLSGVSCDKRWNTKHDEHVRSTHEEVSGVRVPLHGSFDVGGFPMDGPHDPNAPAELVANCRCTLDFIVDPSRLAAAAMTAAAMNHDGAMIALIPSEEDLQRLVLDGGEPIEELHLTLYYLGNAADLPDNLGIELVGAMKMNFPGHGVDGVVFGVNYWIPNSDTPAWVLAVSEVQPGPGPEETIPAQRTLRGVRDLATDAITACGCGEDWDIPTQHAPWVPHICLAYGAEFRSKFDAMLERVGPVRFDRIRVAIGNEINDIDLSKT